MPAIATRFVAAALIATGLAACSHRGSKPARASSGCKQVAPAHGTPVSLTARVDSTDLRRMHVDFDDFGMWFSSLEVTLTDPPEWTGIHASIYYQGEPTLRGTRLSPGSLFTFGITPPPCLDSDWLHLSILE